MQFPRHPGVARAGGAGALLLLTACGASKPAAPPLVLATPADTILTPFADAAGAVWLSQGRWALVSEGGGMVGIVDFSAHSVKPLGGAKSPELKNPFAVFRSGDSLWVADWGLQRLTAWTLDGRLVAKLPAPEQTRGALARVRDTQGRFYVPMTPSPGADGSGNRDSAAIVRVSAALSRFDTVARLAPLDVAEVQGDAGRRFERRVFSGTDQWGALSDGSVWVARVYHNRVDWRDSSGHWHSGDPLPDRVLEVTRADREVFVRTFPQELRTSAEQLPFAAIKPPFVSGFTSADGLVWLEKSRAAFDSVGSWHVVDREGHLLREIRLPGFSRILAAAPGAALAIESDSGHVRALQVAVPQLVSPGVS